LFRRRLLYGGEFLGNTALSRATMSGGAGANMPYQPVATRL